MRFSIFEFWRGEDGGVNVCCKHGGRSVFVVLLYRIRQEVRNWWTMVKICEEKKQADM